MTKTFLKTATSIICLLLIFAPMAIVCTRYDGLYFLLYLAFWVMAPGYLFLHFFKKNHLECKSTALAFVYAFLLGSALLFIEFFTLHAFSAIEFIKYINPILCIVAIFIFYRENSNINHFLNKINLWLKNIPEQLPFIVLWLIATYLCAATLNFFMPSAQNVSYHDFTWQIGNVNQLASAFPFEDIRVAGAEFKYHYFSTLFYAIEKIIFDVSGWVIFTQHQVIILPLLTSLCFYSLFSTITKNQWIVTLFSIFTYTGFSLSHHYSGFMYHLISNINSIGLSTITICALFFTIKPLLKNDIVLNRKSISHILLSTILLLYLSGLKGPYGAIFIVAIICFILMQLMRKIKPTKTIIASISSLSVAFLLVYSTLLSSGATIYLSDGFFSGILSSVTRITFFDYIPYVPALRLIMFIPSLIFTFTLAFFPLVLCALDCVLYVFGKKQLKPDFIFAALLTVIGTVAYYFFQLPGAGQLYFLHCSIPFAGYLALCKMNEILKTHTLLQKLSIFFTICFSVSGLFFNFLLPRSEFSIHMPINYFTNSLETFDQTTMEEHEAFEFLKNYADDDKYVFSTRFIRPETTSSTYHNVSAFSEKRVYFEGFWYAEANLGFDQAEQRLSERSDFFGNTLSTKEKHAFALEKNIGYSFIFKNDTYEEFELTHPETGEFFKLIFENDSISIYEVLE